MIKTQPNIIVILLFNFSHRMDLVKLLEYNKFYFSSPLTHVEGSLERVAELWAIDSKNFYKSSDTKECEIINTEYLTHIKGFCPDKRPIVYALRNNEEKTDKEILKLNWMTAGFPVDTRKWPWRTTVRLKFTDVQKSNSTDDEPESTDDKPDKESKKPELPCAIATGTIIGPKHVLVPAKLLYKLNDSKQLVMWERIEVQYNTGDLEAPLLTKYAHVVEAYVPKNYNPYSENPDPSDVSNEALAILILDQPVGIVTGFLNLAYVKPEYVQLTKSGYREYTVSGFPLEAIKPKRLAEVTGINFRIDGYDRKFIVAKDVEFGKSKPASYPLEMEQSLRSKEWVILDEPTIEDTRRTDKDPKRYRPHVLEQFPLKKYADDQTNLSLLKKCIQSPEDMYTHIRNALRVGANLDEFFRVVSDNNRMMVRCFYLTSEEDTGNQRHYCGVPHVDYHDTKKYQRIAQDAFYFRWFIGKGAGAIGSSVSTEFIREGLHGTFVNAVVVRTFQNVKKLDVTAALRIDEPTFHSIARIVSQTWK